MSELAQIKTPHIRYTNSCNKPLPYFHHTLADDDIINSTQRLIIKHRKCNYGHKFYLRLPGEFEDMLVSGCAVARAANVEASSRALEVRSTIPEVSIFKKKKFSFKGFVSEITSFEKDLIKGQVYAQNYLFSCYR